MARVERIIPGAVTSTIRIDGTGRVIRQTPDQLGGRLPEGVIRRNTTADGRMSIPNDGPGKHSIPNALK